MLEHIFVIGGTGNIGTKAVKDLLSNGIKVTLYARNPTKALCLFPDYDALLTIVQGDYSDLMPFYDAIKKGRYTRLLLLVQIDSGNMNAPLLKKQLATAAYEAGVSQVVDISSYAAGDRWRYNFAAEDHWASEKTLMEIPNRSSLVCLRPGRLASNIVDFDIHAIKHLNMYPGSAEPDETMGWISPNDVGTVAGRMLMDDVAKHGDAVYEMIGEVLTPRKTAAVISTVVGREIPYVHMDPIARYTMLTDKAGLPHRIAYALTDLNENGIQVTRALPILLGRKPETLEEYLMAYKDQLM
ncbi:uncharacterized protein BX664DRAFT_299681 [Halteromyces radiatus]|uniref:uncharacterized protein n=1 Tax=Halteromyces radiatus TaxID=101107 RepID=UPI00221FF40A|nr:uncharacterized protein BX664DRAFT_299681 [Halteromyces radiatus]KAI8086788.1 hypothetical protein BX664DRAFT_299681 [Halteromyces radiatus]